MPGIEKQKPDLTIFHLVAWEFVLSGPIVIWPLQIVNVYCTLKSILITGSNINSLYLELELANWSWQINSCSQNF